MLRYTAESRSGGEQLLKISGIFHIPHASFLTHETRKNYPNIVYFLVGLLVIQG